jgi:hypothetical protein
MAWQLAPGLISQVSGLVAQYIMAQRAMYAPPASSLDLQRNGAMARDPRNSSRSETL